MTRKTITIILALIILPVSFLGFGAKIVEIIAVLTGEPDGIFTLSPLLNYFLASMGFACILCWAMFQGMFHDIEKPKFAMLDMERQLEGEGEIAEADGPLF